MNLQPNIAPSDNWIEQEQQGIPFDMEVRCDLCEREMADYTETGCCKLCELEHSAQHQLTN